MVHYKGQGLAAHREYWHDVIGFNYRMTNICAAIGLGQLEQLKGFSARKRELAERYRRNLAGSGLTFHPEAPGVTHSYWMCSILVEQAAQREPLREHLAHFGIETRPLFYPVHTMPAYGGAYQRHAVAEDLGWRGINLPSWPGLTDAQVDDISQEILNFLGRT
jgi:perosamine synthetase